ncbi:hypothetical protein Dimus_005098 [Dionaea muscipula]
MAAQRTSPPATSNSQGSSTSPVPHLSSSPHPPPPESSLPQGNLAMDDPVVADELDKKPGLTDIFEDFESEEDTEKYQKYEAEYARRLMAKYFSHKDMYGGDIFDWKVAIGDETIKGSRRPCAQSYADPLRCFTEGHSSGGSAFPDETPPAVSNGKVVVKRSS